MRVRISLIALILGAGLAPAAFAQDACDTLMAQSRSLSDAVSQAFEAIQAKDAAAQTQILPRLEVLFSGLPATEIKPQVCNNVYISAYTVMQYTRLNLQRAAGIDTGFPANLPIVKQPQLNQDNLSYALGWIKYEKGDFPGALAVFEKGLKISPDNQELQNEYLASLMQLKRYADVISASTKFIENTLVMTDAGRSKVFQALALAQFLTGDTTQAATSAQTAVYYDNNDSTRATLEQIKSAAN